MNIKTRLKKMEGRVNLTDSRYCSCENFECHLILPSLDEPKGYCRHCGGVCKFDKDAPCSQCGKPVLSKLIKVEPKEEGEYV